MKLVVPVEAAGSAAPLGDVAAGPGAAPQAARSDRVLRRMLRDRVAVAALVVLGILVLAALIGPVVFIDPEHIDPLNRFASPSLAHLFGTDELGRDMLSRVADAGRVSLAIAAASTVISMLIGTAWGFAAGVGRGILDEVLMRIADAAMAIPIILFALIFVAAFGSDGPTLALVVGLLMVPLTARVARSAVLGELAMDYHRALVAVGVPRWRIMAQEILPNAAPALLAQASLNLATSLMVEATLSFVGLGVQPPSASWGTLLQAGYSNLLTTIWYPLFPALAIIVAVGALNTLGDRLQRIMDRNAR